MEDTTKDIEQAAQAMMDAIDPEALRRFFEDHPVEVHREEKPSVAPKSMIDCEEYSITLSPEELASEVDFGAYAHAIVKVIAKDITPEEAGCVERDLNAHFASEKFQRWFLDQIKDEPFTRLSQQFAELSLRVHKREINYDHIFSFDEFRTALLRRTIISTEIPKEIYPKRIREVHSGDKFVFTMPLSSRKKMMVAKFLRMALDHAAVAHYYCSESERDWKAVYLFVMRVIGGPTAQSEQIGKPFAKKDVDRIIELTSTAYYGLFADIVVINEARSIFGRTRDERI